MDVWAIADLHLSFGVPNKTMDIFGENWKHHAEKIAHNWKQCIHPDDAVLIAGDISWAMNLTQVKQDLEWVHALPGQKIIIKGNHDYWWPSNQKLSELLPPSIHFVHRNAFHWKDDAFSVAGARLWDSDEYCFDEFINWTKVRSMDEITLEEQKKLSQENKKIFLREMENLKTSLEQLSPTSKVRVVMTHYPPIGPDLLPSEVSRLLEEYKIDYCIFGHLHNVKEDSLYFGDKNGVSYILTSCDYLDFMPKKIFSLS